MEEHEDDQYCFQDRNSSCKRTSISAYFSIILYVFFTLISAVTVFLNLLVIISISHFKQLHTATNLLILSLAVSDLLVGLIVIPSMTVAIMEPCWVLGEYFCPLLLYPNFLCASSSLGNLVLISIDRYVAVCDPLMYNLTITTTRIMCCIFITWFCCVVYDTVLIHFYVNIQVPRCFDECFSLEGHFWVNVMDNGFPLFHYFLPLVNSFINPIIYAIFYPWFKLSTKHIFTAELSDGQKADLKRTWERKRRAGGGSVVGRGSCLHELPYVWIG
ncbi:trace amine-associated receptor 6-like [Esox lucius]|uniref:trace amine-associated receptor 6-like n=1 Tax=Esox lucius TaxID=8010 RepID=UPI001476952D|nr:trace amine-associated receptor 6-like [Esox lucius]